MRGWLLWESQRMSRLYFSALMKLTPLDLQEKVGHLIGAGLQDRAGHLIGAGPHTEADRQDQADHQDQAGPHTEADHQEDRFFLSRADSL